MISDACSRVSCSRVTLMEDASGNVLLKNLSLHHAASDEDALNLLFTVRHFVSILSRCSLKCLCVSLCE